MRPSVTGSGQKSGRDRDHTSSSRPLPSIDPYPPIYPEANGHSFPISPTEKLIEREPQ